MENEKKKKLTNLGFAAGAGSIPFWAGRIQKKRNAVAVADFHAAEAELAAEESARTQKNISEALSRQLKAYMKDPSIGPPKVDIITNPPSELVYRKYPIENLMRETGAEIERSRPLQKELEEFLKEVEGNRPSKFGKLIGEIIEKRLRQANRNAYTISPLNLVVVPQNASSALIAHELGHLADFKKNPERTLTPVEALNLDSLYKPITKTRKYLREVAAWDLAGVPETDPIRRAALKSYRTGLGKPRVLGWGIPLAVGTYGLAKLFNRKHDNTATTN